MLQLPIFLSGKHASAYAENCIDICICFSIYSLLRPLLHICSSVNKLVVMIDATDSLDEKLKNFFKKCATTPNLKSEWKDEQMAKLKQVNAIRSILD